ncbi:hypothetical protein BKD26_33135 [Streptomyces sp. CB03238]|nr:hypothetical protein BKD26_33135 [Streptomyces sp. CB03238]
MSIRAAGRNVSPSVPQARNDHSRMRNNPALRARSATFRLVPRTRSGGDRLLGGSPSPVGCPRRPRAAAGRPPSDPQR